MEQIVVSNLLSAEQLHRAGKGRGCEGEERMNGRRGKKRVNPYPERTCAKDIEKDFKIPDKKRMQLCLNCTLPTCKSGMCETIKKFKA